MVPQPTATLHLAHGTQSCWSLNMLVRDLTQLGSTSKARISTQPSSTASMSSCSIKLACQGRGPQGTEALLHPQPMQLHDGQELWHLK